MRGEKQSWTCQERWVKNKQRTSGNLWDEVGWYSRLSPRVIPKHLIRSWQYLKAPGICTHQSYTDKWVRSALTAVYPCRCCCTPMGLHQLAHKGQWRKRRCPPSSALHQTGLPPLSGAIIPTSSTLPTGAHLFSAIVCNRTCGSHAALAAVHCPTCFKAQTQQDSGLNTNSGWHPPACQGTQHPHLKSPLQPAAPAQPLGRSSVNPNASQEDSWSQGSWHAKCCWEPHGFSFSSFISAPSFTPPFRTGNPTAFSGLFQISTQVSIDIF